MKSVFSVLMAGLLDRTMFIRFGRGLNLGGMESHVFLPMMMALDEEGISLM